MTLQFRCLANFEILIAYFKQLTPVNQSYGGHVYVGSESVILLKLF